MTMSRVPTAMSLKTQKPSPLSLNAWWVPPVQILRGALGGGASGGGRRAAATVPPVDAKEHGSKRCVGDSIIVKSDGAAFLFRERAPQDAGHVSLLVHGEHVDERRFLRVFRFWTAR